MNVFGDYAYYYNAFYGDKDYHKEATEIIDLIKKYAKTDVNKLLNMGCGTGRHDIELAKIGNYDITGIDMSPNMIKVARSGGGVTNDSRQLEFELADIREYRSDKRFDVVISMFHVMSYQNSNEDMEKAIATASLHLEKEGLFIFDVWYGPGVLTERPLPRIKKVEDDKNLIIRYADPEIHPVENIVDVNYDVIIIDKETSVAKEIKECHNMRYFFTPEIKYMLEKNGFEYIDCLDCNHLDKPSFDSWTVYFVARKRG